MSTVLFILALVCGLVAVIASAIGRSWFAAVGFLGVVFLALIGVSRLL